MHTITDISHSEEIYTITRLNRECRFLLEGSFPFIWVEGEISNFIVPNSQHWYFSLKDSDAQVRCAMFRPQNRLLHFQPKDGMHVLAKVRVSLYEGRGDFQLLVEILEEAGIGKLQKEFEKLKIRLANDGLFTEANKKPLPLYPQCIGIITSPTGAAVRDILHVLKRRYPSAPVIIYPTLVQGETASDNIVYAIQTANIRKECDALILARGGGSIEDLWCFNEESVAHAIYRSEIPIISGIGHEIDFTIADFVADVRAATPTAAAELLTPDSDQLNASIEQIKKQYLRLMKQHLILKQQHLSWVSKHLQQEHPKRKLAEQMQKLDLTELSLVRIQYTLLAHLNKTLETHYEKLKGLTPEHRVRELTLRLQWQGPNLARSLISSLQQKQQAFAHAAAKLDALSPLATLKRGFAIVTTKDKKIVHSKTQVAIGDKLNVQFMEGNLVCGVIKIT